MCSINKKGQTFRRIGPNVMIGVYHEGSRSLETWWSSPWNAIHDKTKVWVHLILKLQNIPINVTKSETLCPIVLSKINVLQLTHKNFYNLPIVMLKVTSQWILTFDIVDLNWAVLYVQLIHYRKFGHYEM